MAPKKRPSLQLILFAISSVVVLTATALLLTGILTHSWQCYTTSDTGKREAHQHGLWKDCFEEEIFVTQSKTVTCFFKLTGREAETAGTDGARPHQHKVLSLSELMNMNPMLYTL